MITGNNINQIYEELLIRTLDEGVEVSPRNFSTKELHPFLICLENAQISMLTFKERYLNIGFQCAEALWILSGSDEQWIYTFNENLKNYTNDGILMGAYGPRIRNWYGKDQLRLALDRIKKDEDTRRATITIFDSAKDYKDHRDIPCTNMFRFSVREGKLDMITIMRSQDLWLGFPYDIFTFTLLHELMAGFLNIQSGKYFHFVDSLHIYEREFEKVKCLLENNDKIQSFSNSPRLKTINELDELLDYIKTHAVKNSNFEELDKIEHTWWRDFALCILSYKLWKTVSKEDALYIANSLHDPGFKANMNKWYNYLVERGSKADGMYSS
ncbi:MAG: thymidylate synthase [Halanaerobiales bacterium]|nr:thymidylate synthase [Halanaerobiales bacterium]